MSENISPTDDIFVSPDTSLYISGGAMLRMAREAEGLHIGALAVSLKVPVKKLEALEADQFDSLPDIVFVRALASSVCRTLKIDPVPVLEKLPGNSVPHLKTDESGINTPFRSSGDLSGMRFWDQLSKPIVLSVSFLLVGVLILSFIPFKQVSDISGTAKRENHATVLPSLNQVPVPVEVESKLTVTASNLNAGSTSLAVNANLAGVPVPVVSVSDLNGVPSGDAPVSVLGSGATTGLLTFKAHGVSWVEVKDAGGVIQVRKTMADGEVVGVSGTPPFAVVVGRADATDVQVRGVPYDIARLAKDNVARFEVK